MTGNRLLALTIAILAAAAGGCGNAPATNSSPTATAVAAPAAHDAAGSAVPPDPARAFSSADIEFLAAMLTHHAAARQMTELAERRATASAVRAFAAASRTAQQLETDEMQRWLVGLGVDPAEIGSEHDHNGRTAQQDVSDLASLTDAAFDRRFVELVGAHGVDATALAKAEASDGFNNEVRQLAAEIARREWSDLETARRLG